MSRLLVADTETTGLDPKKGHRVVEIALYELDEQLIPTNKFYHQYVNPERDMPKEAEAIHGLSDTFLRDFPTFHDIAKDFCDFLGDAPLIIHNAPFDMKFINFELQAIGYPSITSNRVIDTLELARKKFPGSPCSLDALCKRFNISLDERSKHGALIDTKLLASVYIELTGGKQRSLSFQNSQTQQGQEAVKEKKPFPKRHFSVSEEDLEEHKKFILSNFKKNSWNY